MIPALEAPRFLEILAALVQHEAGVTPAMIVAVTIRADRYELLQIAPELAGIQSVVFDELKPMPPAGFKEVITGPARRATAAGRRLMIEPALVERLLTEAAEGADALPLLALTLERLYRDFGADGDLTVAEYESMGGMATVVQTEVDKILAADPEQRQAQLDILHDAFIPWLATINPDNDQPMRRLARWEDLPAASHPLVQAMVEKRLLVKDTREGQTVVEVALESLLRQWRELAAWLRAMTTVFVVTAGSGDTYRVERVYLDAEQAYGFAQDYNGIAPVEPVQIEEWQVGAPPAAYDGPYWRAEWWARIPVSKRRGALRHTDEGERFDDFAIRREWWTGDALPDATVVRRELTGMPKIEVVGLSKEKVEEIFWDAVTQARAELAGVPRE